MMRYLIAFMLMACAGSANAEDWSKRIPFPETGTPEEKLQRITEIRLRLRADMEKLESEIDGDSAKKSVRLTDLEKREVQILTDQKLVNDTQAASQDAVAQRFGYPNAAAIATELQSVQSEMTSLKTFVADYKKRKEENAPKLEQMSKRWDDLDRYEMNVVNSGIFHALQEMKTGNRDIHTQLMKNNDTVGELKKEMQTANATLLKGNATMATIAVQSAETNQHLLTLQQQNVKAYEKLASMQMTNESDSEAFAQLLQRLEEKRQEAGDDEEMLSKLNATIESNTKVLQDAMEQSKKTATLKTVSSSSGYAPQGTTCYTVNGVRRCANQAWIP